MKPYGNNRYDNLTCKYGCCHGIRVRGGGFRPRHSVRRASAHRARQKNHKLCLEWNPKFDLDFLLKQWKIGD